MQIIENWTEITGKVVSADESSAVLKISERKPYEDYPDMLNLSPDGELTVRLKNDDLADAGAIVGSTINAMVRAAGPNVYLFRQGSVKVTD